MFNFLNEISSAEKTIWYIALPSTIIFVLMLITTLFGIGGEDADAGHDGSGDVDAHGDTDTDHEHSGFDIWDMISFKNLVYFLTFFSWGALSLLGWTIPVVFAIIIAFVVAIGFTSLLNLMFIMLLKLQEDSTTNIEDAIDKTGEVYLTIPKGKIKYGKVKLILNGANRIYKAKSYSEKLPTGTKIVVLDVEKSTGTLVVTKDI